MSTAAGSTCLAPSTPVAQANIFIMQLSGRPPESWERHSCQKRCRCGIVGSERCVIMTSVRDQSPWMTDETRIFQKTVRQFIEMELAPHHARWAEQGHPDAEAWIKAGKMGLVLRDVPEEYGGGGGTFSHEAIIIEELSRSGVHFGFSIQSIVAHYILAYGSEEQRHRWLPRMACGELVGAVGVTEPHSGSDLQGIRTTARRDGEHYGS